MVASFQKISVSSPCQQFHFHSIRGLQSPYNTSTSAARANNAVIRVCCNARFIISKQCYSHGVSCLHSHSTVWWTPQQCGMPGQSWSSDPDNNESVLWRQNHKDNRHRKCLLRYWANSMWEACISHCPLSNNKRWQKPDRTQHVGMQYEDTTEL